MTRDQAEEAFAYRVRDFGVHVWQPWAQKWQRQVHSFQGYPKLRRWTLSSSGTLSVGSVEEQHLQLKITTWRMLKLLLKKKRQISRVADLCFKYTQDEDDWSSHASYAILHLRLLGNCLWIFWLAISIITPSQILTWLFVPYTIFLYVLYEYGELAGSMLCNTCLILHELLFQHGYMNSFRLFLVDNNNNNNVFQNGMHCPSVNKNGCYFYLRAPSLLHGHRTRCRCPLSF
jgi:hypothetical protein